MTKKVKIRGMALRSILRFVEYKKGKKGVEQILASLDEETKKILLNPIPKNWYPYEIQVKAEKAVLKLFGSGDKDIFKELGKFMAEDTTQFFLKFFLRFATPQGIIKKWPTVWKLYFKNAEYKLVKLSEKSVITRVFNFPEFKHTTCDLVVGWGIYSLEAAGARNNIIKETKCIEKGDDCSEWHASWE